MGEVETNLRMKKYIFLLLSIVILNISLNDARTEVHGKIIGGMEAEVGEFPWQVSVRNFLVGISHFCGGSIIDPHWILTACNLLLINNYFDGKTISIHSFCATVCS